MMLRIPTLLATFVVAVLPATVVPLEAQTQGLGVADAVRATIAGHPDISLVEQQVAISAGDAARASGPFETQYRWGIDRSREATPLAEGEALSNLTAWRVGFARRMRSGTTLSPSVGLERRDLNFESLVSNRATASLLVTQPLLRGRGSEVVTAVERAARLDLAASRLDLRHTVSSSVFRTLVSYWAYLAAARSLDIVREAEARAGRLVEDMQTLINAGNRPSAELRQVQANLADRTSLRLSSEHGLIEARQSLGLAMGLPLDAIAALPLPGDRFPAISVAQPAALATALTDRALSTRADLDAARQRTEQARTLMATGLDAVKPKLDVQLGLGYAGLDHGRGFSTLFTPIERRASGPNLSLSFNYDWSVSNAAAHGLLAQQDAIYRQNQIRAAELQRTIGSAVVVAQDDLLRSGDRVRTTRESADLYRAAVEDERQKLQLGLGTIIDLVLTEERLTQSLLEEINAEFAYARAVARLRFESSTLVDRESPDAPITIEQLTTIPDGAR